MERMDRVSAAHDRLAAAVDALAEILDHADDADILSLQIAVEATHRRLDHLATRALAAARHRDAYGTRGYRTPAAALADLLRWEPRRARRFSTAADDVTPRIGLDGTTLPARCATTATVFASGEVSLRHVEVISGLLASTPAARLAPEVWEGAESALATQALLCTPAELHTWGAQLIEALDQDGPTPDDRPEPQINELRIARHRHRPGGTLRARYDDAEMFDRIATTLEAMSRPADADDPRDNPERAAEALSEVCGHALTHAPPQVLPETGGQRPQLTVTIRLDDLEQRARTASLDLGGRLTPAAMRMLACDAAVVPVVLGGQGQPLDVGRATRTIPRAIRRAVTARDRGCAHPGCDRPPTWCEIHHIIAWERRGPTSVDNCVMLCRVHHRLVHASGWEVRITTGRPEFVPPGWIDPQRRPRRRPDLDRVPGTGASAPGVPGGTRPAVRGDSGATVVELTEDTDEVEYGPPQVRIADLTCVPDDPPAPVRIADLSSCVDDGAPPVRVARFADSAVDATGDAGPSPGEAVPAADQR